MIKNKPTDMDLERVYRKPPYPKWHLCGEEWFYDLFHDRKPKQIAKDIIESMFGSDVENKFFIYWVRKYNGHNNLQDGVVVYYRDKLI